MDLTLLWDEEAARKERARTAEDTSKLPSLSKFFELMEAFPASHEQLSKVTVFKECFSLAR